MLTQPSGQPILVGSWDTDDDFPVFPTGSKPKRMLFCPADPPLPHLIGGHAYLFKTVTPRWQHQLWSEVIAYRLGALVGLQVPPCFVAFDERTNQAGALMEFFYGYPGERLPARLIHGADMLARFIKDTKRGRPHSVRGNISLCRLFLPIEQSISWWAAALAFDAVIGNTDRHPDNWGALVHQVPGVPARYEMAPLFDNGTSLGYELVDSRLANLVQAVPLQAYLSRGTHHCGWSVRDDAPTSHFTLCERLLEQHEVAGAAIESVIRFDRAQITSLVHDLLAIDVGVPFTIERANFIVSLILARQVRLKSLVEGYRGKLDRTPERT